MNAFTEAERIARTNVSSDAALPSLSDEFLIEQLTKRGFGVSAPSSAQPAENAALIYLFVAGVIMSLAALGFVAQMFFDMTNSVIRDFDPVYVRSLYRWDSLTSVSGIVAVLLTFAAIPGFLLFAVIHFDDHAAGKVNNSGSAVGQILKDAGYVRAQSPQATVAEKGRSQFATLPSVQQNGIWKP